MLITILLNLSNFIHFKLLNVTIKALNIIISSVIELFLL